MTQKIKIKKGRLNNIMLKSSINQKITEIKSKTKEVTKKSFLYVAKCW